jgi:transcriptional regulator with XRE-family HTH domain
MTTRRPPLARRPNPVFSDEYGVIREILVEARREAGLSQRALAARLGKWGSHVAMVERGQRRVDLLEFCRIADSLGISADGLLQRIVERLGALREAA